MWLGGYSLCTVHVGWLYSTCIIYWVGFAHPVPLSLSSWGRRNSTVCGHFLLYVIQDTQMHDLKMKQGLMFLASFPYEYCKVAEAGTLEWGSE